MSRILAPLIPDDGTNVFSGVELEPFLLGEVFEKTHAFETVHVIAVHVREQDVVDSEQV